MMAFAINTPWSLTYHWINKTKQKLRQKTKEYSGSIVVKIAKRKKRIQTIEVFFLFTWCFDWYSSWCSSGIICISIKKKIIVLLPKKQKSVWCWFCFTLSKKDIRTKVSFFFYIYIYIYILGLKRAGECTAKNIKWITKTRGSIIWRFHRMRKFV